MSKMTFLLGDCLEQLKTLPDNSVHTCITSPPYFNLRDYATATWEGGDPACDHVESIHKHGGERADRDQTSQVPQFITVCEKCGAVRVDKQIGLEETPEEYVDKLVQVFREVKRVLREDGTLWLNIGDTYATSTKTCGRNDTERLYGGDDHPLSHHTDKKISHGLKNKDLIGIPWRLAFALQADGFYLRQDIIWCLSGGTWIYARTQKGDMPIMVRDLIRLKQETVKLWNGEKWTQLLGVSKSKRQGTEIEIVLRSGERISCTPTHRFPTNKGVIEASQIIVGDVLTSCILPEPENVKDCVIDEDASWLAGLYIAEGSMSEDTIQIAGHRKESERWDRVQKIAVKYGGSATMTIDGNNMSIRMYGKVLVAILNELVSGRTSKDKCFNPVVWRYSNRVIKSMLDGYLSGDGHKDGDRWRLEFCRNYNLERDLRVACARLGYSLTLNLSTVKYNGKDRPTFRGEIRKSVSNHFNNKNRNEVVKISKARCRYVYDLGVEDEPHLFSLASGVLTHNSKPNPMPESVTDRCTKSHEYIFLLTKSPTYYFDHIAIREDSVDFEKSAKRYESSFGGAKNVYLKESGQVQTKPIGNREFDGKRNKRSVWEITPKPFKEAHFAVYPPDLIEPCVLAGTSEHGCCSKCGAPYKRIVEKKRIRRDELPKNDPRYRPNKYTGDYEDINGKGDAGYSEVSTKGWEPTCDCHADIVPCTVLDPFMGSGTTGLVAKKNLRSFVGIELSPEYMEIAKRRINKSVTQLDLFGRGIGV